MRALMVLVAAALVGCGPSRGMMLTGDGRLVPATPETWRAETERVLAEEVAATLPAGARVSARIAELPVYGEGRRAPIEGWYFPELHARLAIEASQPIERDAVVAVARAALAGKAPARDRIEVVVERSEPAAARTAATSAPAPSSSTPRSYVARPGDTLADLSLAFYGTSDEWRRIRDANPAVDFAALTGGERLVIPPR